RVAGAGAPGNRHELAVLDVEGHAVQGANHGLALLVVLGEVIDLDHLNLSPYWARNAVTGSSRAARNAGMMPATVPRNRAKPMHSAARPGVMRNSEPCEAGTEALISAVTANPRAKPTTPPARPMKLASSRNSRMTRFVVAPIAFLMPISRTRSLTAMIIVLITARPPMTSASSAAAVVISVNSAPPSMSASTILLGRCALTPVT